VSQELIDRRPPRAVGWMSGEDPFAFDNRNMRLLNTNARTEVGCPAFGPIFALGRPSPTSPASGSSASRSGCWRSTCI